MTDTNPTVDEVFTLVSAEIEAGSPLQLSHDARTVVPTKYRGAFTDRLQSPGIWERDRDNVLRAARQLGTIASAIATLRREPEVSAAVMETASEIVEGECEIGFQEGRWCTG